MNQLDFDEYQMAVFTTKEYISYLTDLEATVGDDDLTVSKISNARHELSEMLQQLAQHLDLTLR